MSTVTEVAAGVILRGGYVLACQRGTGGAHPRKWEFPGGKRNANESLPACLERELREELQITAVVGPELWRVRYYYEPQLPLDVFFFCVRAFQGEVANCAFADLRWLRPGELSRLDFLDADRSLVEWLSRREGAI